MSGFTGINQFGSLTTQNGQRLTFKDFDKDNDGVITEQEVTDLLNSVELDSVNFSFKTADVDGNMEISNDEFEAYDQKVQIQDFVNSKQGEISNDFSGNNASYLKAFTDKLNDFIENFAKNYDSTNIQNMASDFEAQWDKNYAELKNAVLPEDKKAISSRVLDTIYNDLTQNGNTSKGLGQNLTTECLTAIMKAVNAESTRFINAYKGDNLEADLTAHLQEFLYKSDADKMEAANADFEKKVASLGGYLDNDADLASLKEYVTELLTAAIDKGVIIKLKGSNIASANAIATVLKKYTDATELYNDIKEAIGGLSTTTKLRGFVNADNQRIADEAAKAQAEADKKFASIPGSAYAVNSSYLDYSGISLYASNGKPTCKGKDNRGQIYQAYSEAAYVLKGQIQQQMINMLKGQGISDEKINEVMGNLYENVFNASLTDCMAQVGTNKTNHKWRDKKKTYEGTIGMKDFINTLINSINTNMASNIDAMNASDKDMDTMDLDFTAAGKNEEGNAIVVKGQNLSTLYQTNGKVRGLPEKVANIAAKGMCDKMRNQFLAKAKAMCDANGIEFDNTIFTTMFNNAEQAAINAGVTPSFKLFMPNRRTIDARTLLDTLSSEFKTNYTNWVNAEVSKKAATDAKNQQ